MIERKQEKHLRRKLGGYGEETKGKERKKGKKERKG